jgi:hypothetical protein
MHSVSLAQARHVVAAAAVSQMGVVGVAQSLLATQPPQAPLAMQTRAPSQLSGVMLHFTHVSELPSQIGVAPLQPELFVGLQAAQRPRMHWVLPSLRPAHAVLSAHSEQAL